MDQENDDKKHMIGIRKFTYWKTYGVKRFPYRGKRKYTPLVYQSDDGGIVISNDVFGLTIRQFERIKPLGYQPLIRTIGTEIDIRKRQILFILHDKILNADEKNITQISSGSLAEGLDLPGSDEDIMIVDEVVNVTQIERNIKHPVQRTEVFMETDTDHPGFTRLRLISHMWTNGSEMMSNLTKNYKLLKYIESIQNSESSSFVIGVCKFHYATISQQAAQLLPSANTNYNIRTSYHRHLHDGLQRDAVTGWLLYASFYYVTEQYNVTLRLTEYILSIHLPDMVQLREDYYSEADINNYRHRVHSSMSLNAKMKTAVVDECNVRTALIINTKRTRAGGRRRIFHVSPIIMAHCLRFLCYHHIGDTFNRQQHITSFIFTTLHVN
ncbi:Hypothetical predicted protein [Mytilus galloprovincialis]|uniref:Uncharacterized protein n=1 Tax=Mytilus galloprovincialis TaxID=29158 RepID=A0A8B6EWZ1_MYTGA|nr:Hypothetical predicted protein [Mytilus galloprovincialis]